MSDAREIERPQVQTVIGVDIGGTKTAVATWRPGGRLREVARFATAGPEETLAEAGRIIRKMRPVDAAAIGVACGGPLDAKRGLVLSPPNLPGWNNVPILRWFEETFSLPVFLMNDANASALAEWRFGAGRGSRSMVFLTAGTGMGAGLILNGALYEGASGNAGEIGHVRLAARGPTGYRKAGSFEGFCSGGALPDLVRFLPRRKRPRNVSSWQQAHPTAKTIAASARMGDPVAMEVLAEAGRRLGQAVAMMIDTLNPEVIVLGTLYVHCRDFLKPEMSRILREESLPDSLRACRIVSARLGDRTGQYGAVCAALHGLGAAAGDVLAQLPQIALN